MKQTVLLNRIIFVLSLVGILIAVYVTQSFLRKVGIICVTSGCELVRKSPSSYLLGVPVPSVGLLGYAVIAMLAFARSTSKNINLLKGILGMTIFGVCFTLWFTYTELFVIRGICMWCAISTVNMFVLFFLAVKSYSLEKKGNNYV
ncbi:MAG: vitamin K epoxide reductase family protein [Candidatus Gottesmanbacteria bacterium]|nr:vitamin K epoxide reductase family protein [Candidatus Gottesmanbacteria bacterium]